MEVKSNLKNDGYIKIYNCFFDNNSKYKLYHRENYFYSLVAARWSPFLNYCELTISTLTSIQNVFANKDESVNKQKVWDIIESLCKKDIISIECDGRVKSNGRIDYDKPLRIHLNDLGGYESITKIVFDNFQHDSFCLYFAYLCCKFNGYSAKYETISEHTGTSTTLLKEKIKSMIESNKIYVKKGKKLKDDDGKFSSNSNTYYIVKTERNQDEIETVNDNVPEYFEYKNKQYKVTDLRDNIINKNNIYVQHYFYVHTYQDEDPLIYQLFCESKKAMENKGFDFTKMEAEWDNYKRIKKEEKNDEYGELMFNAVRMKGSNEYVKVTNENVDDINFDLVEEYYYYNGEIRNEGKFVKIVDLKFENKDELPEGKYDKLVQMYKELVMNNRIATSEELIKIREMVNE